MQRLWLNPGLRKKCCETHIGGIWICLAIDCIWDIFNLPRCVNGYCGHIGEWPFVGGISEVYLEAKLSSLFRNACVCYVTTYVHIGKAW